MNLDIVAEKTKAIITILQPFVAAAKTTFPETAAAMEIADKLLLAALNLAPEAETLIRRVAAGESVTDAELFADIAANEAAYKRLDDELKRQIAELP